MKLHMKLLSDCLPGSGQVYEGLVDNDIVSDPYGLPYIPGKRIKGILRESAHNLKDVHKLCLEIDKIFDKNFRISNGYLKNYETYYQFLKSIRAENDSILKSLFDPQNVMKFFTYTRSQTAIHKKTGVAQSHSLRTMRVLKGGLEFVFDLTFNHQFSPEDEQKFKQDQENIFKVTKEFGTSRTRGLGRIILTKPEEETAK